VTILHAILHARPRPDNLDVGVCRVDCHTVTVKLTGSSHSSVLSRLLHAGSTLLVIVSASSAPLHETGGNVVRGLAGNAGTASCGTPAVLPMPQSLHLLPYPTGLAC
jgi:hypothetical protein